MYVQRNLSKHLKKMMTQFPILSLTGPRQSGKTTLLKKSFPDFKYFNLERVDHRELILADIHGFLETQGSGVIFDEAQHLPDLFSYIQAVSDERNKPGQYILSGSQSFLMNERISQSLAGRVYIGHLFPFDMTELPELYLQDPKSLIVKGFYPRLYDQTIHPEDFYPSYLQTYIERDIRSLKAIENMNTFTRFLGLCAGRTGQLLNLTSLANDAGVSINTAKSWISLLEASYILFLLQPYHKSFQKRLIKSPKIYFYDTGVLSSLLRITQPDAVQTHYAYGALFENLVISELVKRHYHSGKQPAAFFWRESNGTEIDCILEKENQEITAIDIKGGQTFNRDFLKNLKKLHDIHTQIHKVLIYAGKESISMADVQIIGWNDFVTGKI
jgi:hypothetical protein